MFDAEKQKDIVKGIYENYAKIKSPWLFNYLLLIMFPRKLNPFFKSPKLADFTYKRQLGKGSYGEVVKYTCIESGIDYAIKIMKPK